MDIYKTEVNRDNLLFRLAYLTRRWRKVLDAEFQSSGLTDATWRPLLHLNILGNGVRQKDLAASVGIEGPSLVRLIDTLVVKGLIQRSEDSTDRRAKLLCLTPEGQLIVARIKEIVAPLENELLSPFSDSDICPLRTVHHVSGISHGQGTRADKTVRQQNLYRLLRREWPRLVLAARGTVAAVAALAVAVLLKLECPYWAAMTALIVIQPTRGLLLEKSYYRLLGTAVGSVAGMMMLLSSRSPAMLTILLALWLAACVAAGNLQYGLRSYGAMVAGCTGAVIAMAGYNNPPHLHDLVFGRIACIVIGIVVSTTVTLFFTHRRSKRELLDRLAAVTMANIEWVAMLVRGGEEKELIALRQDILVEIADIEGTVDAAWAGSLDLKRRKRHVRDLVVSLLALLETGKLAGDHLVRQDSGHTPWRESLARHLEDVALHLAEQGSTRPDAAEIRSLLSETHVHAPLLAETLAELINALQLVIDEWDTTSPKAERPASTNSYDTATGRSQDGRQSGRRWL